jgi:hypothetical protein
MNTTNQALQKRNAMLEETLVHVSTTAALASHVAMAFALDVGLRGADAAATDWAQLA